MRDLRERCDALTRSDAHADAAAHSIHGQRRGPTARPSIVKTAARRALVRRQRFSQAPRARASAFRTKAASEHMGVAVGEAATMQPKVAISSPWKRCACRVAALHSVAMEIASVARAGRLLPCHGSARGGDLLRKGIASDDGGGARLISCCAVLAEDGLANVVRRRAVRLSPNGLLGDPTYKARPCIPCMQAQRASVGGTNNRAPLQLVVQVVAHLGAHVAHVVKENGVHAIFK